MMVAATVLASCSKNTDINVPQPTDTDSPQVCLTLGADDYPQSRAFFDNTALAETWESEIKTLAVYVFNASGEFVVKRSMTAAEIKAKTAQVALPNVAANTPCSFFVVANGDYGEVATRAAMEGLIEKIGLDEYNGTFAQVSTGSKRSGGFVMTGRTDATVLSAGSTTPVAVSVKRTVAKIAVRAKMDAAFPAMYNGGTITISSIKVSRLSATTYSYNFSAPDIRSSLYEFSQTAQKSASGFDALFYGYANKALAASEQVVLTLSGFFDADGNAATTTDRSDAEYKVELTGAGSGEIRRNGYYRVDAVIKGLSGDAVGVNISVENWETPVTQTVQLGN